MHIVATLITFHSFNLISKYPGVHLVTCKSAGMVMYLQPDAVIQPLKAAVGEEVLTAYGDGIVESYSFQNNMYTIKLNGWGAKLYAVAETFDRVESSMRDRDGAFGMNWLVRIFFSSSLPDKPAESTRSRSNSLVSAVSMRSQSARSTS
uniref:Uncharacterized protein n=1 Tax=Craspedostauros australis TaxID=1486917 RepID=A0A6T6FZ72_9STRA|mmetsp:Transcript_20505/g.57047  ORF Transcript_20505/g.57047 Transcript_20505/m.57047 type:complete len:149 (+) Transcript_20505:20-466(+)